MVNCLPARKVRMVSSIFWMGERLLDVLIARLAALNIPEAPEIVADCIDSGRLPWLVDYMSAREALHDMEVETYVR